MEKSPTTFINTEKETRSFLWFMTMILIGLTAFTIIQQSNLHKVFTIVVITLLVTANIVLHWLLTRFIYKRGFTLVYMLIQEALIVGMILITRNLGITLGLTMALFGESVGVFGLSRKGLFAAFFYLALSLGVYFWVSGSFAIGWWLLGLVPMMVFVAIYVELYSRQSRANAKAQQLLAELESTNRQLTAYAAQVEDLTIASERQRMARELHDTLSQGLAGLILQLEAVDANLAGGKTERGRQIIQQAMESARLTLSEARMAIDDLRQRQHTGCSEDLEKKVTQFTNTTGIPCEFNCSLTECLTPEVADAVVGVVTESLMNISRHAQAKHASVKVDVIDGVLSLEIKDDGLGFEPASVPGTGHYGLMGMRERVDLVHGQIEVISSFGAGTSINVRIPCL